MSDHSSATRRSSRYQREPTAARQTRCAACGCYFVGAGEDCFLFSFEGIQRDSESSPGKIDVPSVVVCAPCIFTALGVDQEPGTLCNGVSRVLSK
jgi:hypothetical protein